MNKVHACLLALATAMSIAVLHSTYAVEYEYATESEQECFTDSCVGCIDDCLKAEQYVDDFLKEQDARINKVTKNPAHPHNTRY